MSSGRDRNNQDRSRDHFRQRSPQRGPRTDYRGDRRNERRDDHRPPYGGSGSQQQGHGRRYDRQDQRPRQPEEDLPKIPDEVPVPKENGAATKLQVSQSSRGTQGIPIRILANHFTIQSLPVIKIYQYDVRMTIPLSSQRHGNSEISGGLLKKAWEALEATEQLGKSFVHDIVSTLWSCDKLLAEGVQDDEILLNMPGHREDRPNQILISVRLQKHLSITALMGYLRSGGSGLVTGNIEVEDCFRFIDALFKDRPRRKFLSFPKTTSFFIRAPGLTQVLPSTDGVLEAIRGIHQSVAVGFNTLTLNIDTKTAAFYVGGLPLPQLIRAGVDPTGLYFVVKHLGPQKNEKKMKVQRLSTSSAIDSIFDYKQSAIDTPIKISVYDYFKMKHKITLKNPNDKLIITSKGAFPPELCFTASGERYKEPLQGKETADFIRFATGPAFERKKQIMANVARISHWNDEKVAAMGFSVSPKMLELPALALPAPLPIYQSGPIQRNDAERGSWNLRGMKFVRALGWKSWGIVCFQGLRGGPGENDITDMARKLDVACQGHGMQTARARPPVVFGSLQRPIAEPIDNCQKAMIKQFGTQEPQLMVVLLMADMPVIIYKQVKQYLELRKGVASQVLLVDKCMGARGGSPQYMSNVAMKINVKLGGCNAVVRDPLLDGTTIILGGDVSHPSPGELRSATPPPSMAALVCSMDKDCARYSAVWQVAAQQSRQELMDPPTMEAMLTELFNRNKRAGNGPPGRIIYFRDSVSDSQISKLESTEISALKKVRDKMVPNCKITVIHAVKRHHTRFFPVDKGPQDKLGNVLPGTVVERSAINNDVFMVSQSALQGTVRPTHYVTLLDENNLSITEFERLILQGCYSYQKATRSVSIHSAVYYADQCAERAKFRLIAEGDVVVLKDVHPRLPGMYWQ